MQRQVHHGTALNGRIVFVGSVGVDAAAGIPIIDGIRINQSADGAMFRRQLRFDSTPYFPVAGNNDGTGDVNAISIEHFIVFPRTVVYVHQMADHVAVWRKRVVRWQYLVTHGRTCIGFDDAFREGGLKVLRLEHLKHADFGNWDKNLVSRKPSVVTPLLKQRGNVLGVPFALR